MRGWTKLVLVQTRLFLREPAAFFFTLAFPVMLLLLFGAAFGNEPSPVYDPDHGFIDYYAPALMAFIAGTVGMMGVPVKTAAEREYGILRRFQATPLSPLAYFLADLGSHLAINLLAGLLTVFTGFLVYDLVMPSRPLAVFGAIFLGALGFAGLGYLIAALAPTARTAQAVGSTLFFPMMFVSGVSIPPELLPEWLQRIAEGLPMTRMVHLVTGLWLPGAPENLAWDLLWLGGMAVVGLGAASRIFRWS